MSDDNLPKMYNKDDFQERVTDSVRSNIGMLIPEEEFDNLVQKEIKAFFEEELEHTTVDKKVTGYNRKDKIIQSVKITPFRKMVWDEVERQLKSKLKDSFKESKVANAVDKFWGDKNMDSFQWDEYVENLTKEIAPKMAEKMFERIVAEAVDISVREVQDNMRNY